MVIFHGKLLVITRWYTLYSHEYPRIHLWECPVCPPRIQELEDGLAVVGAALSSSYAEVHADRLKLWQALCFNLEIQLKQWFNIGKFKKHGDSTGFDWTVTGFPEVKIKMWRMCRGNASINFNRIWEEYELFNNYWKLIESMNMYELFQLCWWNLTELSQLFHELLHPADPFLEGSFREGPRVVGRDLGLPTLLDLSGWRAVGGGEFQEDRRSCSVSAGGFQLEGTEMSSFFIWSLKNILKHILKHISTYFHIFPHISTYFHIFPHISTYFNIFQHISTYFNIWINFVMMKIHPDHPSRSMFQSQTITFH